MAVAPGIWSESECGPIGLWSDCGRNLVRLRPNCGQNSVGVGVRLDFDWRRQCRLRAMGSHCACLAVDRFHIERLNANRIDNGICVMHGHTGSDYIGYQSRIYPFHMCSVAQSAILATSTPAEFWSRSDWNLPHADGVELTRREVTVLAHASTVTCSNKHSDFPSCELGTADVG